MRRLRAQADPPTLFLLLAMVASGLLLLTQVRGLWFVTDEWSFLTGRSLTGAGPDLGLLAPHNEHWTTIPVLVYRGLFQVFGLRSYLPYVAVSIALHLLTCVLLYVLMRRAQVHAWAASLAVVVLVFLCGGGAMNALWAFQMGFLGSAALGLLALVLSERLDSPRSWVAVWLVSVASLMSSGMALSMLAWLGALVLLRHGLRRALVATVPPALVYLVWYAAIGHVGTRPRAADLETTITFVLTGLARIWGQVLTVPETGGVVFLALVVTALVAPAGPPARALALSGVAAAVVAYVLLALARADTGVATVSKGRYIYFGLVFTLPAMALLLGTIADAMKGHRAEKVVVFGLLVVLFALSGFAATMHYRESRPPTQIRPGQIKGAAVLADSGAALLSRDLDPTFAVFDVSDFLTSDVQAALPSGKATSADVLDAGVQLQVAARREAFDVAFSSGPETHGTRPTAGESACTPLVAGPNAWVDLPPSVGGAQVSVVVRTPTVQVRLIDGDARSHVRPLAVSPGARTYVATTADATLRIFVAAGPLTLCRQ